MKQNVGALDRLIRLAAGGILILLYASNGVLGAWSVVWLIIALILIIAGILGFCPVYSLLGINTCTNSGNNPRRGGRVEGS